MHRTQTRLRTGFGLVAMMAVLAMVAFMTMVSSNGTTSASTGPTPTPDNFNYKVLAKVTDDSGAPTLVITKESGQVIVVDDVVLWNGQRWNVTARPDETHITLAKNACASQGGADFPADSFWIYLPKPCDDGNLSNIVDLEITTPNGKNTLYHCIVRNDHDVKTNLMKSSSDCYSDVASAGDPSNVLSGVQAFPNEGPNYPDQGPPPPPPYIGGEPNKGLGTYYPTGAAPECTALSYSSCTVSLSCTARTGAGNLGPNLGSRIILNSPKDDVSTGKAELYAGLSNQDCADLNIPTTGGRILGVRTTDADGATPVSWRTQNSGCVADYTVCDYDGDGCPDYDELAKPDARPKTCGADPWNPTDSNVTDHSGAYGILVEVKRADTTAPGTYFSCLADIQQNLSDPKNTSDDPALAGLVARAFCYQDSISPVNKLGFAPPFYPTTVTGDGYPGGGPGWGAIPVKPACVDPLNCTPTELLNAETNCDRYGIASVLDEDSDGVVNDGCPSEGFGDTDSKQTELVGYIDNADNTIKFRGCFEDEDASSSLKYVYIELQVNRYTGIGTVDIFALQDATDCTDPHVFGNYQSDTGSGQPAPFDDAYVAWTRQPGGDTRDTDQDGCPNAKELGDDPNLGGLRDPYNPYDWYDTNKDGSIDLFIDILGVIGHYSLDGSPPYDINWDRGGPINGGAGSWSRKAPDNAIDLFFDILGVISQYSLTGCT